MAKSNRPIVKTADVEKLGRLQCTVREAAAFLGIRVTTLGNLLKKDKRIRDAWERGKSLGLLSLRRKQMRLAGVKAQMAIFLGKNYLGQRDVSTTQLTGEDGGPVDIDVSKLDAGERNDLRQLLHRATRTRRRSKDPR
jgi:hypothetical protein